MCICIVHRISWWYETKSWRIPYLTLNLKLFPMVAFKLLYIWYHCNIKYSACIPYTGIQRSYTYSLTWKAFLLWETDNFLLFNPIHFKAFDNAVGDEHEPILFILILEYAISHSFHYSTTGKCLVVHLMWLLRQQMHSVMSNKSLGIGIVRNSSICYQLKEKLYFHDLFPIPP